MTTFDRSKIREEMREMGQQCTCANIRRASRVVTQMFDAALQPSGLKATQVPLLGVLAGAGEMTLTNLADTLVMDRTTLTRNLKPLMNQGLVQSTPGADRRIKMISLTDAGWAALDRALPMWRQAQASIIGKLGKTRWRGFTDHLAAVSALHRGS